tara:strand:- start:3416 stop:3706 length:291 start_codon:yes stop_codon:yes gene_type:complete
MQKNIVSSVNRAMGLTQPKQKNPPVTKPDTTEVDSLKEEVATLADENEDLQQSVDSLKSEKEKLQQELEELKAQAKATAKKPAAKKKKKKPSKKKK